MQISSASKPVVLADPDGHHLYPDTVREMELLTTDRERLGRFYADVLGWVELSREPAVSRWGVPATAALSTRAMPGLRLVEDPRARMPAKPGVGLFHASFQMPNRAALAAATRRLLAWSQVDPSVEYHGYSDHGVSEAIYGTDPDGNGVELTLDRPFAQWPRRACQPGERGALAMSTRPLDPRDLLAVAPARVVPAPGFSHLHLQVSDLALAEELFVTALGMDVVERSYPGALFVAHGDYHHHIGANIWRSQHAPVPPAGTTGLLGFTLQAPDGTQNHYFSTTKLGR